MFIYQIDSVDKLISIAKGRDYILNNPDLCQLLENPYLKDDTELALKYNDYKHGIPDAGKEFVDYFYMHGPELDTGSLVDWRDKIINDPILFEYAQINDLDIGQIWEFKQQNPKKNYSWLGGLLDCLSRPCTYSAPMSPIIGGLADTQGKYNLKNAQGDSSAMVLFNLPTRMANKLPEYCLQGIGQLTEMISTNCEATLQIINREKEIAKPDPYIIKDSELISGDLLSDIGTNLGDCFRIYEQKYRYNAYNYEQNKTKADSLGTIIYNSKGEAISISMNGNKINQDNLVLNSNMRLVPKANVDTIITSSLPNLSSQLTIPIGLTAYNGILADGVLYTDDTNSKWDTFGLVAGTSENGLYTIPNRLEGVRKTIARGNLSSYGCATRPDCVIQYFNTVIKNKYPDLKLPSNFESLVKRGYKSAELHVMLQFPGNKVRDLVVFDTGGGQRNGIPWVDIAAQFFYSPMGKDLGYVSTRNKKIIATTPTNYPVLPNDLQKALDSKSYDTSGFVALSIPGTSNNTVQGLFYFTESFCQKNGLDINIYGPKKLEPGLL